MERVVDKVLSPLTCLDIPSLYPSSQGSCHKRLWILRKQYEV
jgi:hypothetical protein